MSLRCFFFGHKDPRAIAVFAPTLLALLEAVEEGGGFVHVQCRRCGVVL